MGVKHGNSRYQPTIPMSLDDQISDDNPVRIIDALVDGMNLSEMGFIITGRKQTGRPAYAASDLLKLYIYGYETGIRSSRMLERETGRNIELMWLLKNLRPDHKTISEFRRINPEALEKAFRYFVGVIDGFGLIGKEIIAVDGTKIKASNSKKQNFSAKKLARRIKGIEEKIKEYLDAIGSDEGDEELQKLDIPAILKELEERKAKYEGIQKELQKSGETEVSLIDPDARLMKQNRGGVDVSHNIQSAVDSKHHIILDYNVTKCSVDHGQLSVMAAKVMETFKLEQITALADKGFYNGADLTKCKENKVTTIVPRQDNSSKAPDERFNTDKFIYDEVKDEYLCPGGKLLTKKAPDIAHDRDRYFNQAACRKCQFKELCTKGKYRTVTRSFYREIYAETDERTQKNLELYKQRQRIVEHPFGTIKRTMNGGYFLLRTERKVRSEVALLFFGYNLKRLISIMGFDALMKGLKALSLRNFFILPPFLHQTPDFAA